MRFGSSEENGCAAKGRRAPAPASETKEALLGMDSGGFLWDEFSELLWSQGAESFLCSDLQELDGEIKGALIESDGIFKSEKPLGGPPSAGVVRTCAGYASDAHFLLRQNCISPAGKEQQFTGSAGREGAVENQRRAAGRNRPRAPHPRSPDGRPGKGAL